MFGFKHSRLFDLVVNDKEKKFYILKLLQV
jgi:hypothetical protein